VKKKRKKYKSEKMSEASGGQTLFVGMGKKRKEKKKGFEGKRGKQMRGERCQKAKNLTAKKEGGKRKKKKKGKKGGGKKKKREKKKKEKKKKKKGEKKKEKKRKKKKKKKKKKKGEKKKREGGGGKEEREGREKGRGRRKEERGGSIRIKDTHQPTERIRGPGEKSAASVTLRPKTRTAWLSLPIDCPAEPSRRLL